MSNPSGNLFPSIWKLIRLELLLSWNSFKHARTRRKVGTIILIIIVLGVAVGLFILSWLLLGFLHSPKLAQYAGMEVAPFLQSVPVLVFAVLFLFILLSSFGVLLQALYLSGDMDFLLTSPVPVRAVFVTKLLQAVLPNFGLILLFGLPVLFGLGVSEKYHFLYFPFVLLSMAVLALAAAGLSAVLVMLVARLFPPRRVAEVLGLLVAVFSVLCGQSGNLYNTMGRHITVSGSQVNGLFSLLTRLSTIWNPLNWVGRGLVALGERQWLPGFFLLALTLGLSALAFMLALGIAERWYYTGWASMQVVTHRKKRPRTARRPATASRPVFANSQADSSHRKRVLGMPLRALIWKDFLLLRRDMRNLSGLITPLIFGVLYTIMFLRPGGSVIPDTPNLPDIWTTISHLISTYGNIGMSLFVGWMLLVRLSGMAFSSEGRNYWILKASPMRAGQILVAKFLVAWLPALALGMVFLVGVAIMQKIPLPVFLYGLLVMGMCQAGMNGILLSFGVLGANFTWTDPRRMNAGGLGCVGQVITPFFLLFAFSFFIGPLVGVTIFGWPPVYGYASGLALGAALSLTCALLPPWLVRKRVERLAEN